MNKNNNFKVKILTFGVFVYIVLSLLLWHQTAIISRCEGGCVTDWFRDEKRSHVLTMNQNSGEFHHSYNQTVANITRIVVKDKNDMKLYSDVQTFCDNTFIGYGGQCALINGIIIDPAFGNGRHGGEEIHEVLKQNEKEEFYDLKAGFFKIACRKKLDYVFHKKSYLNKWKTATALNDGPLENLPAEREIKTLTLALIRFDYANLYWAMGDLYDVFLTSVILNTTDIEVNILFVDGHPTTPIDDIWKKLFSNNIIRIGSIEKPIKFHKMAWVMSVYNSPILGPAKAPLLEEYRGWFLSKLRIPTIKHLDCKNVSMLIIWRKDYVAHPRNPTGKITRKITNEKELLENISKQFKGHDIKALQLDLLSVEDQIKMSSRSDILLGMHGAGLSHSLFVPSHAALVELFPISHSTLSHFQYIAKWRNLVYSSWKNGDRKKETDKDSTVVDAKTIAQMVVDVYHKMCPDHSL